MPGNCGEFFWQVWKKMANDLIVAKDPRNITIGKFSLTSTGLVVDGAPEIDEWKSAGLFLQRVESASQWWIGDWLVYGEGRGEWGEMYDQAISMFDCEYDTIRQYRFVAESVQFGTRVTNLSWAHHREVAGLSESKQRKWLRKAVENHWSVRELKAELSKARSHELLEENPLPTDKYRCIVIDPPWPVEKISRDVRPNQTSDISRGGEKITLDTSLDYPTMTLEAIEELPVGELAGPDCHLYLWVTQKFLPVGIELLQQWAFDYQCLMTWVKPTGFTPFSWMYNTEHVLFARRGSLPLATLGQKLSFEAGVKKGEHSRKPDVFYERVLAASPKKRLEMFARGQRDGFDVWGNEAHLAAG